MNDEKRKIRRKIATIVVCVAASAASWYVFRDKPYEGVPDDVHLREAWACEHCGEILLLTPREHVQLIEQSGSAVRFVDEGAGDRETIGGMARTSARQLVIGCPKCREFAVVKAARCATCDIAFPRQLKAERQKCPKCGWDPWKQEAPRSRSSPSPRRPVERP